MTLKLGVIADDYTGATDISVTLLNEGMRVIQIIGPPEGQEISDDIDVVVVALKSRMVPASEAVALSLKSLNWLQDRGAEQIFFKYCST